MLRLPQTHFQRISEKNDDLVDIPEIHHLMMRVVMTCAHTLDCRLNRLLLASLFFVSNSDLIVYFISFVAVINTTTFDISI